MSSVELIDPFRASWRSLCFAGLGTLLLGMAGCGGTATPPPLASSPAPTSTATAAAPALSGLEWIGEAHLPSGGRFQDTLVGGLSGLAFDPKSGAYYAVSDDRSQLDPARIYRLAIDLSDGRLDPGDFQITGVIKLRGADGRPYPKGTIDAEGLVLLDALIDGQPGQEMIVSTEGDSPQLLDPFVARFRMDGQQLEDLPLPDRFRPSAGTSQVPSGVRRNLGFESLTLTPDGSRLFTATEAALAQDGPVPDLDQRSPARLLEYRRSSEGWTLQRERLYPVEPVAEPAVPAGTLRVRGLVELLALDADTLLALERSYSNGAGYTVELYRVDLAGADDLRDLAALPPDALDSGVPRAVTKELLFDLGDLGVTLDNLEAMTLGPTLLDGRRTLLILSDDNFLALQSSQLLAFAIDREPVDISRVQGAGHRSPLEDRWVFGLEGIVTAVLPVDPLDEVSRSRGGFWMQEPQLRREPGASQGLFVATGGLGQTVTDPQPGDALTVHGRVSETGRQGNLTVTRIEASWIEIRHRGQPLPEPVLLAPESPTENLWSRMPPTRIIDNDGLRKFEPQEDAIDFYESLEGMRLEIRRPRVVGPTNRFGEIVLAAEDAGSGGVQTPRGGLLVRGDDPQAERLFVAPTLGPDFNPGVPRASVGDRFTGAISGVLDYGFGSFKLLNTAPLPELEAHGGDRPTATLGASEARLTVATYNVENLSLRSPAGKLDAVAHTLVLNLGAPDLVALQEIQDDSGPEDNGVVSAAGTLDALVAAIEALGGPRYTWCQIDPEPNTEGGRPGANIRVALLFNADRLSLEPRGVAGPRDSAQVEATAEGPRLSLNPGRVAAADVSFTSSRRPLAAQLSFHGVPIFVIVNHFNSKGGDDGLFGAQQPPEASSETQRLGQAAAVAGFVGELLALDPQARVVVLGDLNELPWRAPLARLQEAPLVSLMELVPPSRRYSYIYQGGSQLLDHLLVSPALAATAAPEIEILHINSDFADRASDHDPVLARFTFELDVP